MRLFFTFLLALFYTFSYSQDTKDSVTYVEDERPKAWQGFSIDFGLNSVNNKGNYFQQFPNLRTWGSRSLTIYYFLGIRLNNTLTLAPGFGVGIDNYMFQSANTRVGYGNDSLLFYSDMTGIQNKKSKITINQFDIPIELRFKRGTKPKNTFRLALGIKGGLVFNARTKIKYERSSDGETVKEKKEDDFALQRFRYGITGRIGYGYLNVFGYYSLSNLFKSNKGPEVAPFTIGISLSPNLFFNL